MKALRSYILSFLLGCLVLGFTSATSFAQTDTETPTPTPTITPTFTPAPTQAPGNTATPTPTCTIMTAPTGITAVSSGPTQIALSWTAPSGSVSDYLLSYGTAAGNYSYGNPDISGNVTTYTVGSLSKGIKYYFALKAQNNCSTSNFSSEVSATAGETPSGTPSPSPEPSQAPEEQTQPQTYQAANEQAVPQQAIQGAQTQQGGFVTIPTFSPTPTPSPIGGVVNIVSLIGAAIVFLIVGLAVFYYFNGRQGVQGNEKVEF